MDRRHERWDPGIDARTQLTTAMVRDRMREREADAAQARLARLAASSMHAQRRRGVGGQQGRRQPLRRLASIGLGLGIARILGR